MGYGTREGSGGTIRTFWPDDTENEFYIEGSATLADIKARAEEKWPGTKFEDINIEPQYIHTDCLGYDRYDPSDYTNFLRISLKT